MSRFLGSNSVDRIEADFLQALSRLQAGKPTHEKNIALAEEGRLKITISSVALEAGRSRTLIAKINCKYPQVRERVLAALAPSEPKVTAESIIKRLRRENDELARRLNLALSAQAALSRRITDVEKQLQEALRCNSKSKVVSISKDK